MNIMITCSQYNTFLTASGEHAMALLALVPHLRIVEQSVYGDSLTYKVEEMPPKIEFIDSAKIAGMSETEQRLAKALDSKNTEWATAYTENSKNKARVAELERQLASLQQAA